MADILIVDDQDRTLEMCRRAIPEHSYRGPARSWKETAESLARARGRIDLVLLDVHFAIAEQELLGWKSDMTGSQVERLRRRQGLEILRALRERYPELPVVLMTARDGHVLEEHAGQGSVEEYTYFLDDEMLDARSLKGQIASIVEARRGQEFDGPIFWGRSMTMRRIRQRLSILARGRLPVVLFGPTGTGKSLIARHFVHQRSERRGNFVAVDLATIPADLMSSHLFGSIKGAYTGSQADRTGAFEAADGGTLFLDEIGNLSLSAQKMLLSVLQEGAITRLGDLKERPVDVKLIVATNEDLAQRVRDGTFRADLYMRLNPTSAVVLPSLKQRHIDFEQLIPFVLKKAMQRPALEGLIRDYRQANGLGAGPVRVHVGSSVPAPTTDTLTLLLPERTMRLLRAHTWPGNLRQIAMTVENALVFAMSEMLLVRGGERADIIQIRPKLVRDLLDNLDLGVESTRADSIVVSIEPEASLNKVAVSCEKQYFVQLYIRERGDFGAMARQLLGDEAHARKVQLRFNQLGLRVRELREKLV